jgi:Tfp pilus assembly protein PilN
MHGIDNLFVQLANAVVAVWRGRSVFSQPSLFGDPEADRRSRFWLTVVAVVVTLFAAALAAGAIYLLWWSFTIYQRRNP